MHNGWLYDQAKCILGCFLPRNMKFVSFSIIPSQNTLNLCVQEFLSRNEKFKGNFCCLLIKEILAQCTRQFLTLFPKNKKLD